MVGVLVYEEFSRDITIGLDTLTQLMVLYWWNYHDASNTLFCYLLRRFLKCASDVIMVSLKNFRFYSPQNWTKEKVHREQRSKKLNNVLNKIYVCSTPVKRFSDSFVVTKEKHVIWMVYNAKKRILNYDLWSPNFGPQIFYSILKNKNNDIWLKKIDSGEIYFWNIF